MGGGLEPPPELLAQWATDREKFPYGERRDPLMPILLAVSLALTLVVVVARLWARCKIRRNAGLDDWLIVAALPSLLAYDTCTILGFFYYGIDRHAWEVTVPQAVNVRIVTLCMAVAYILTTTLVKVSILCFYRRLSEGTLTLSWIWIIRGFIGFVIAYGIIFSLMLFVDCRPLDAFWNKMNPKWRATHGYTCFNEGADFMASAVVSVIQDATVFILPLLVVHRLQIPRKQKLALAGIFGIGFFLCICGIIRAIYMYRVYYETYDTTWDVFPVWLWTSFEIHFAVICASAPALKLFFTRILQSSSSGSYTSRQRRQYLDLSDRRRQVEQGSSDDASIYMEDMLAYKEARARAAQAAKDSPIFSNFADTRSGSKSPTLIRVTQEVDVSFSNGNVVSRGNGYLSMEDVRLGASHESLQENVFRGSSRV